MVEHGRLPAELVAVDLLRLERHEVEDVLRRLRRRLAGLPARVEAAAFEALRIADVDVVVRRWLELDRGARRERFVDALALEIRSGGDDDAGLVIGR